MAAGQSSLGLSPVIIDEIAHPKSLSSRLDLGLGEIGLEPVVEYTNAYKGPLLEFHFSQTVNDVLRESRLRDIPRIMHFHGPWGREGLVQGNHALRACVKTLIERKAYKRFELFTTHSTAFKALLVNDFGIQARAVRVIYPGIDTKRFSPGHMMKARGRLGLPLDEFIFVSIRRLEPRMGLDLAITALAKLPSGHLAIAGDGSSRSALEQLAKELGVSKRVTFLGRLPDSAVADLYRSGNCAIVPTRALEGFGLVVLESFSCGTPVISANIGGLPEAMGPWAAEWTFEPGNASALQTKMQDSMNGVVPCSSDLIAYSGENSWDGVARKIEDYVTESLMTC